jgi:hypothetical protein
MPENRMSQNKLTRNKQTHERRSDDPRQRTDKGSLKQTNEPWKPPVEKEQEPQGAKKSDLERWHKTSTH